jgi:hypothetical protein
VLWEMPGQSFFFRSGAGGGRTYGEGAAGRDTEDGRHGEEEGRGCGLEDWGWERVFVE